MLEVRKDALRSWIFCFTTSTETCFFTSSVRLWPVRFLRRSSWRRCRAGAAPGTVCSPPYSNLQASDRPAAPCRQTPVTAGLVECPRTSIFGFTSSLLFEATVVRQFLLMLFLSTLGNSGSSNLTDALNASDKLCRRSECFRIKNKKQNMIAYLGCSSGWRGVSFNTHCCDANSYMHKLCL
jgi:hypothetical protein